MGSSRGTRCNLRRPLVGLGVYASMRLPHQLQNEVPDCNGTNCCSSTARAQPRYTRGPTGAATPCGTTPHVRAAAPNMWSNSWAATCSRSRCRASPHTQQSSTLADTSAEHTWQVHGCGRRCFWGSAGPSWVSMHFCKHKIAGGIATLNSPRARTICTVALGMLMLTFPATTSAENWRFAVASAYRT